MSSESVKRDIENALDQIKADDPDLNFEIEMQINPKHGVFTVVMRPFYLPKDQHIIYCVLRQYRTVTGCVPEFVGIVLSGSFTRDGTCHL